MYSKHKSKKEDIRNYFVRQKGFNRQGPCERVEIEEDVRKVIATFYRN